MKGVLSPEERARVMAKPKTPEPKERREPQSRAERLWQEFLPTATGDWEDMHPKLQAYWRERAGRISEIGLVYGVREETLRWAESRRHADPEGDSSLGLSEGGRELHTEATVSQLFGAKKSPVRTTQAKPRQETPRDTYL